MPYGLQNAYGGTGSGSGMKMGAVYDPNGDIWQSTLSGNNEARQSQLKYGNDLRLLQQQQQPELQKLQFEQSKWNTLLPYLQRSMGSAFNSRVGGQSGAGPRINAAPIYDQGKIQQADNAFRAQGDQQTASQVNDMRSRMAGSGYGANSPLAAALETQMGMGNRANTANQVREFGQNAAQQNASHVLQGQTAQEAQYSNRMQEDIARRRNLQGYQTSLLGMLGQFL